MANVIAPRLDTARLDIPRPGPRVRARAPYPVEAEAPLAGSFASRVPVGLQPQHTYADSVQARSVIDDYYETIHVRPARLQVGRLTSTVRREVEVWNAYRDSTQTLERIDVTRGDGINVSGPEIPHVLQVLASTRFTVDVTPDGPATIDARYSLVFTDLARVPFWSVTGTRIIEWSIPPNWADPVDETLSYKTEVLTAFDGSEQRIALRSRPRRAFSFTPLAAGAQSREMQRLLSTWQNRVFAMADWPRGVRCPTGAPVGSAIVILDEPLAGLEPGGVVVFRQGNTSRVLEVADVTGATLTLNAPLAEAVGPDTRVFRGLNVHAESSISSRRLTSAVGQLRGRFREMHVPSRAPASAAPVTWRGLEAFLTKPNWATQIDTQHEWNVDWVDSGRGAFDYRTPVDAVSDVRKMAFIARDRDEVAAFEAFFHRCRGRRGEFYAPTWDEDVALPDVVLPAGDLRLPVDDAADANRLSNERVYRNLLIRLADGTSLYRQAYAGGGSSSGAGVLLDAGWPRDLYPGDVLAIHFLPRCRLASDDLTIRWLTDGKAEISLAFQVLPDIEEHA